MGKRKILADARVAGCSATALFPSAPVIPGWGNPLTSSAVFSSCLALWPATVTFRLSFSQTIPFLLRFFFLSLMEAAVKM